MKIQNLHGEKWKPIKGFENYYEVSNKGRVKSLSRDVKCSQGFRTTNEKILSTKSRKGDYEQVVLYKNKKSKGFKVQQLVAIAFLNHVPDGGKTVVDHKNSNKKDNRLCNLQVISQRENCIKSINKEGKSSKYIGVQYLGGRNLPYIAKIRINQEQIVLGRFKNELDAYFSYKRKLESLA